MGNKGRFIVGGAVIGVFVIICGFILALYLIPTFKPGGMAGVFVPSKYMTYMGDDVDYIFGRTNFIIQSNNTEVIISVGKTGYEDEGRVQVFEDANGIAFNSRSRTQVDFYEVWDNGTPYVKIHVREPKGAVARKAQVYLNLLNANAGANYNFVLNTGKGDVTFRKDEDAVGMEASNIWVNGTGRVTYFGELAAPKVAHVGNLIVNGNATVNCLAPVDTVDVKSATSNVKLGAVANDIDVKGKNNTLAVRSVGGNLAWEGNGHISVEKFVTGNLTVKAHNNMSISATNAAVEGNFELKSFDKNIIGNTDFGNVRGSVAIGRIHGTSTVQMIDGSLTLGKLDTTGTGVQFGTTESPDVRPVGCFGDVKVDKRSGGATVNFSKDSSATGTLDLFATFGTVDVWGMRGKCLIDFATYGDANVKVAFFTVVAGSRISYLEQSFNANKKYGEARITFLNQATCSVLVTGSRTIKDQMVTNPPVWDNNEIRSVASNGSTTVTAAAGVNGANKNANVATIGNTGLYIKSAQDVIFIGGSV